MRFRRTGDHPEVRTNGSTCSAQYSGNLPHNRPCDQCGQRRRKSDGNTSRGSFRGELASGTIGAASRDSALLTVTPTAKRNTTAIHAWRRSILIDDLRSLCSLSRRTKSTLRARQPEAVCTKRGRLPGKDRRSVAMWLINRNSPGIFAKDATGTGEAAAVWLILSPKRIGAASPGSG